MRRVLFGRISGPLVLRLQHVKALTIVVTMLSLSFLFSTFSIRGEENLMRMTTARRQIMAGSKVIAADDAYLLAGNNRTDERFTFALTAPLVSKPNTLKAGMGEVYLMKNFKKPAILKSIHKNKMKLQGYILPAPSALLKSKNLFQNRLATQEDMNKTLEILSRKLEESKNLLSAEIGPRAGFWNVSYPRRLLLVTSWRSGSTFLGQILSEHPGVYNHYEPLMHVGVEQIRPGDPRVDSVVQHLRDLLGCRYLNGDFLRKIQESMQDMLSHNAQVWSACVLGPNRNVCSLSSFLEEACHRFPAITMKMVRLRLNLTRALLDDPSVKVLYLVRDPRATMNSRLSSVKWCSNSIDCIDPSRLCNDIQSDLDAFESLSIDYPNRLALIKYETLAKFPHITFRAIFDFAGLFYTQRIRDEVERHTSRDENHPWSTVRKSAERINLWRQKLDRQSIIRIQLVCSNVLTRLGYSQL